MYIYLQIRETTSSWSLQKPYAYGPRVVAGRGSVSYGRGTPVGGSRACHGHAPRRLTLLSLTLLGYNHV